MRLVSCVRIYSNLIIECACLLNNIPKAKFDSTRGLPVSSPVWT